MCGIWAHILRYNSTFIDKSSNNTYADISRIRGPDTTNEVLSDSGLVALVFLVAIVGPLSASC